MLDGFFKFIFVSSVAFINFCQYTFLQVAHLNVWKMSKDLRFEIRLFALLPTKYLLS